jgi:hypothetical protein
MKVGGLFFAANFVFGRFFRLTVEVCVTRAFGLVSQSVLVSGGRMPAN